ncbi:helix-hairpin-helix domain-containing protein [Alkalihalobacillus macyae]|uniref:helix-hairpin-helix domain-containing protein n=1 Tax=Guptibacillus hwajinpoensis TaxID=208199 RepID=UPI00273CF2D2|nr:helix-hairpin-helix domain-containing protein [Alkalihalobacillus macyae]MDP4550346.1 helix-hairpin-helix domain-containing protein [Alkalihalobacillus macyae]
MKYIQRFTVREKILLAFVMLGLGAWLFYYFESPKAVEEETVFSVQDSDQHNPGESGDVANEKGVAEEPEIIMVDVKGAVINPGVYEMESLSRVKDVITRAGGFVKDADQTQLNLAGKVTDEMVIYVPVIGEISKIPQTGNLSEETKLISINTADLNELQELPGIGPSKAEAIIQYREENGAFKAIEDLQNISGIGEKTFEKLKDLISIQ